MVFIVYIENTHQVNFLANTVLYFIKHEKDLDIEVTIQSEVSFLTNEDR